MLVAAMPLFTTLVVPVVGMDALERPLSEIAHRPEKIEALLIANSQLSIINCQRGLIDH